MVISTTEIQSKEIKGVLGWGWYPQFLRERLGNASPMWYLNKDLNLVRE